MHYVREQGKPENMADLKPFWWGEHHVVISQAEIKSLLDNGFLETGERAMGINISHVGREWFRNHGMIDNLSCIDDDWWITFSSRDKAMMFKLAWA